MGEDAGEVAFDVEPDAEGEVVEGVRPLAPRSDAEIYMDLARAVIASEFTPATGLTRWDVRTWWRDEGERRAEYRVSRAQEAELMELCRAACEPLAEGARNPAEWKDEPKAQKPAARGARKGKR
jgi:hypothetical protein